jgi:S1-C subfamily serine protease
MVAVATKVSLLISSSTHMQSALSTRDRIKMTAAPASVKKAPSPSVSALASYAGTPTRAADKVSGSGVVVGTGEVLANTQIVEACTKIRVILSSGDSEIGALVARDEGNDLSVISLTDTGMPLDQPNYGALHVTIASGRVRLAAVGGANTAR